MTSTGRRLFIVVGLVMAAHAMTLGGCARAKGSVQDWPTRPVTLVVPNVPGGAVDILARLLEKELTNIWKQPIIIQYKPGAGTVIGTDFVAKSQPDGYTLGLVVKSHVINPSLLKQMPYDTEKDLSGVSLLVTSNVLVSASPKLPVHSISELIAYARTHKGKVSFATPGAGSSMHLAGEQLNAIAGADMVHVPYKGSGGAYMDVAEGRVHLLLDPLYSSMPHVKAGRLKPLAILNDKRDATAPDIPAIGETLPNMSVQSITGVVVPSATPRKLVARISADLARVLKHDEVAARLNALGLEPLGTTPEQFDAYIRKELKHWKSVVEAANIKVD